MPVPERRSERIAVPATRPGRSRLLRDRANIETQAGGKKEYLVDTCDDVLVVLSLAEDNADSKYMCYPVTLEKRLCVERVCLAWKGEQKGYVKRQAALYRDMVVFHVVDHSNQSTAIGRRLISCAQC